MSLRSCARRTLTSIRPRSVTGQPLKPAIESQGPLATRFSRRDAAALFPSFAVVANSAVAHSDELGNASESPPRLMCSWYQTRSDLCPNCSSGHLQRFVAVNPTWPSASSGHRVPVPVPLHTNPFQTNPRVYLVAPIRRKPARRCGRVAKTSGPPYCPAAQHVDATHMPWVCVAHVTLERPYSGPACPGASAMSALTR